MSSVGADDGDGPGTAAGIGGSVGGARMSPRLNVGAGGDVGRGRTSAGPGPCAAVKHSGSVGTGLRFPGG